VLCLTHRSSEYLAVPEDAVRHLLAELDVFRVRVRVGGLVVEHDHAIHLFLSLAGGGTLERMTGEIVHYEIAASDVDRAQGFWEGVFGWSFQGGDAPFPYLMTQGEEPVGAIFQSDEAGTGPIVYMATDDIDATLAKVGGAGGTAGEKQAIPGIGWFARCKDTEGNSFSLFQGDENAPGSWG